MGVPDRNVLPFEHINYLKKKKMLLNIFDIRHLGKNDFCPCGL